MPIKLLDAQRRAAKVGTIRLGIKVTTKSGKIAPEKLSTFRFTSPNPRAIETMAQLYGGTPTPWDDGPTPGHWQVVSEVSRIPILVPPGDQAISQWMELWSGRGCERRCDGESETKSGGPCLCPSDGPERLALAKRGDACSPTTRISVVIPRAPGLGTWLLTTRGWNAAGEMGGTTELLAALRQRGTPVPAALRLEERMGHDETGRTTRFVVPMIDVDATMEQLMALTGGWTEAIAALPEAPPRAGITARVAPPPSWTAEAAATDAQDVADDAVHADSLDRLRQLWTVADRNRWLDDLVCAGSPDVQDTLRNVLTELVAALTTATS